MTENTEVNLCLYLKNIIRFMSITVFDIVPQMLGMMFFNIAGEQKSMGVLGFLISSFFFFFCISFNHSEIINLKSGIHVSKGEFSKANKNIIQCILVNLTFYLISISVAFQCKYIFELFGITGEFLETASYYLPFYCLGVGTCFMISCMLRGNWIN